MKSDLYFGSLVYFVCNTECHVVEGLRFVVSGVLFRN